MVLIVLVLLILHFFCHCEFLYVLCKTKIICKCVLIAVVKSYTNNFFCVFEVLNLSGNLIQLATSSQGSTVQQSPSQTNQQTPAAAQNSQTNLGSVVMVSKT